MCRTFCVQLVNNYIILKYRIFCTAFLQPGSLAVFIYRLLRNLRHQPHGVISTRSRNRLPLHHLSAINQLLNASPSKQLTVPQLSNCTHKYYDKLLKWRIVANCNSLVIYALRCTGAQTSVKPSHTSYRTRDPLRNHRVGV
jgi:hypothetical protein